MRWQSNIARLGAVGVILVFAMTSCAPEPGDSDLQNDAAVEQQDGAGEEALEETQPEARVQEETCAWDVAAITSMPSAVPSAQEGDLDTVVVGSWQHTHFDTGSGFEAVENDIRYVFPSSTRLLYCQHVPGITEHAENAADFSWDGTRIALGDTAPGFTVTEWSDDTMVWLNHTDNSTYLLQRR